MRAEVSSSGRRDELCCAQGPVNGDEKGCVGECGSERNERGCGEIGADCVLAEKEKGGGEGHVE